MIAETFKKNGKKVVAPISLLEEMTVEQVIDRKEILCVKLNRIQKRMNFILARRGITDHCFDDSELHLSGLPPLKNFQRLVEARKNTIEELEIIASRLCTKKPGSKKHATPLDQTKPAVLPRREAFIQREAQKAQRVTERQKSRCFKYNWQGLKSVFTYSAVVPS